MDENTSQPEQKLSPAEERERLKEKIKAEMRADKQARKNAYNQSLADKAENLVDQLAHALDLEDSEVWIDKLNTESMPKEQRLNDALAKFKQEQEQISSASEQNKTQNEQSTSLKDKTLGDEVKHAPAPEVNEPKTVETPPQTKRTIGDDVV